MRNNSKSYVDIDELKSEKTLWFAVNEAYKIIRTNLMFSLPEELGRAKIIGITSSIQGEGKTTTSINLAKSFAAQGEKTLLIECDMRMPSIGRQFGGINQYKGLSNLILGQYNIDESTVMLDKNCYLIPAGTIPPNPSELLGSTRFKNLIGVLSKNYKYIILDLPPVTVVSDPLVVARVLDGMILIVRQDFCKQKDLDMAVKSLEIVKDKLLGYVMTGTHIETKHTRKKGSSYKNYSGYSYVN